MAETGTIPDMGQEIHFDGFRFDILYASNKRIETIKLVVLGKDQDEQG